MTNTMTLEVDGQQVIATCRTTRYPRIYEVRLRDGRLLGYVERSLAGRITVYVGDVAPDEVGAQPVVTNTNMHAAVEFVVREAASRDHPQEAS